MKVASSTGLVLTGGGARAAYQVGAINALNDLGFFSESELKVLVGASAGALNTVVLGNMLHLGLDTGVDRLKKMWRVRSYSNTFKGSLSGAFLRALGIAMVRYSSPTPTASEQAIFDPFPLESLINDVLKEVDGATRSYEALGVMATREGDSRKGVLFASTRVPINSQVMDNATFDVSFVKELTVKHAMASAALPCVLPTVSIDGERYTDGGIADNHPVDPAVRLGADKVVLIDISGRKWWHDQYGDPHYTKPSWQVPASESTYCMTPKKYLELVNLDSLGKLLKSVAGRSSREYIRALGPIWPAFKLAKHRMGEDLALEVASYVALHPDYFSALLEKGYSETVKSLSKKKATHGKQSPQTEIA